MAIMNYGITDHTHLCMCPALCVSAVPAIFTSQPSHMSLSVGDDLSLSCAGVSSTGLYMLAWYFNDSPLSGSSRSMVKGDPTSTLSLTVLNLTYADIGNYTCKAANLAGSTSQHNSIVVTGELTVG